MQQLQQAVQNAWFAQEKAMRDNPVIAFLADELRNDETKTYLDLFPAFRNQPFHAISTAAQHCFLSQKAHHTNVSSAFYRQRTALSMRKPAGKTGDSRIFLHSFARKHGESTYICSV